MENIQSSTTPKIKRKLDHNGEPILPLHMGYLTEKMAEVAKNELHETEERKTRALKEFRLLLQKEENLVTPTHDAFLLAFLRARKYDVNRAFKLLQNFFHFFEDRSIFNDDSKENAETVLRSNFMGFLPYRDKNGSVIFIFNQGRWDTDVNTVPRMIYCVTAMVLQTLEDPATQVAGFRVILDDRRLTWHQLTKAIIPNIPLMVRSAHNCLPGRYTGIHFLTENRLFNIMWTLMYPILPTKMKNRMHILGSDLSPLQEHIDPSVLPVEFGGQHESIDNFRFTKVMDYMKDFSEFLNYGYK